MHWSRYVALSLGALAAGCGSSLAQRTGSGNEPAASVSAEETAAQIALGERIFSNVCAACHSLEAPPQAAPPMTHVARHYREAFDDRAAAIEHIVAYLRAPDAERSILPAHAIERFGLMPPQPLPEAELRAVAAYVWQLPAPRRGMGAGGQHGMRGGHRHGQP